MQEETFELYHYHESLCSQMARLALEEKQIDWQSHPVMLNDVVLHGENFTPEYLRINPKALVPTLVHNGKPVYDSWVIIDYLDKVRPDSGTRLTPKDPAILSQMAQLIKNASLDESRLFGVSLGTSIPILSAPAIRYLIKQQPFVQFWWKYRKHPLFHRRWGARMVTLLPVPKPLSSKSLRTVGNTLRNIEALLSHGDDYLLGDYSQVDIMMTAHFHRLEDVALGSLLTDDQLPNIAAYWERLQARPSYRKAITDWQEPTWRQALEAVFGEAPSPALNQLRRIAIA
ncbi:MAG: glutathione S-transferase N-terminal domain-containing protein [Ketobacteraceae bacterium]|nr:glutathione S-transferase N-terminal domain-containing protein [Ketobacteraceae bacterium]